MVPEGVFLRDGEGTVSFHRGRAPSRENIAAVAARVEARRTRWAHRRHLLDERPADERSMVTHALAERVCGGGNGAVVYTNAPDSIESNDRWTVHYDGTRELVDQQMSNPVLAAMLDETSVEIAHGATIDAASDHSPVIATYLVR